ncbi:MAG: hypothetical protein ACM3MK_06825 [Chitinophagales bacterium]
MDKTRLKLTIDILMTLSLIFMMVPKVIGQDLHELVGIIIGVIFLIHIVLNWRWIKTKTLNFFRRLSFRIRLIYILNILVFLGFAAIILSGINISETINFSFLGISRGGGMGWKVLHTSATYFTFLISAIHTGLNFSQVIRAIKPYTSADLGGVS